MRKKRLYHAPSLETALSKLVNLVSQHGELTNAQSKSINAWRDPAKRIWLLDRARQYGVDFAVDGFDGPGRPVIRVFKKEGLAK